MFRYPFFSACVPSYISYFSTVSHVYQVRLFIYTSCILDPFAFSGFFLLVTICSLGALDKTFVFDTRVKNWCFKFVWVLKKKVFLCICAFVFPYRHVCVHVYAHVCVHVCGHSRAACLHVHASIFMHMYLCGHALDACMFVCTNARIDCPLSVFFFPSLLINCLKTWMMSIKDHFII